MKMPLITSSFEGGWSSDLKQGAPSTFPYSRHLDFRKNPTKLTILPATVKESGSVFTDLPTDMLQLPSGKIVAIDKSGGVYTRTTGGSWSKNGTTLPDTAFGMVYNLQQDTIFIPGLTAMHSVSGADGIYSGSPFTVNANVFQAQVDQSSVAGHAASYSTVAAVSEVAADKLTFTPQVEPLHSIKLWVNAKGTGDMIVTLHDAANNVLGTVTIANDSLAVGAYNEFVFAMPPRMYAKPNPAAYHFHVTFSGGTASTIGTSSANSLSAADYQTLSNRFVQPNNGFHPVTEFLQYLCIGNERYVAVWEPISLANPGVLEFLQHRLTLPSGYEVTSLTQYTEYLAIGAEKRSKSATNEFQDGKIFFWDGTSTTYTFFVNVPEGAPYALMSTKNTLYYFAGGGWWAWAGSNPVKIFQMPNTDFEFSNTNTYMINYPNTMTVRNGILLGGFPSETNSTNIEHAVYSFGSLNKNYPNSFGYSYSMSTGSRTNGTLRIGVVQNFGDKLFIGWRDGSSYGIDKVDPNSPPFSTATWESLVSDYMFVSTKKKFPRPDKTKTISYLELDFPPLPVGCTVTPKYKIDREASWHPGTAAIAGATFVRMNINKRYHELQVGFDLTATNTTPEIIAIVPLVEMLGEEAD